jgi:hypothetical protein
MAPGMDDGPSIESLLREAREARASEQIMLCLLNDTRERLEKSENLLKERRQSRDEELRAAKNDSAFLRVRIDMLREELKKKQEELGRKGLLSRALDALARRKK